MGSAKGLASRFYQLKTGNCLTGQYLHWTKNRPTPQCWWCRYQMQTRDHLFKVCPEWKTQQKILWAEVLKETGRWKSRWRARDLLADRRCSRAVPDFLSTTNVGRRVPVEEDAGSEMSGWEPRERREQEEERRVRFSHPQSAQRRHVASYPLPPPRPFPRGCDTHQRCNTVKETKRR